MIADRVISTHNGQICQGTAPNGDLFQMAGPRRTRYSFTDQANYQEVKINGVWLIDSVSLDSSLTATLGTVSPVQDIN